MATINMRIGTLEESNNNQTHKLPSHSMSMIKATPNMIKEITPNKTSITLKKTKNPDNQRDLKTVRMKMKISIINLFKLSIKKE